MLNQSILRLGSYASKSIARKAEQDPSILSLSLGEPVFGPPPAARHRLEALITSDFFSGDLKRYETSLGSPSLREAIADYYQTFSGLTVAPSSQVLVTNGGAGALTAAVLAVSNPGDEILIGDPSYMLYARLVQVLGRKPVLFPRSSSEGYRWDIARLRASMNDRTAALIVNSPENPTGYVCPPSEMRSLVEVCESRNAMLIHDEVYDQFCFSGNHQSAASLCGLANVILVNSTSKKFGTPGLRMGWLTSNEQVVALAAKAQDYTALAVNAFSERAAEALLRCDDLAAWFAEVRASLGRRVALTVKKLSVIPGIDFRCEIAGGMFVLAAVEGLADRLGLRDDAAGDAVTAWMLDRAKVAVVSGSVYGKESSGAIRFVVCGQEDVLLAALARIGKAVTAEISVTT